MSFIKSNAGHVAGGKYSEIPDTSTTRLAQDKESNDSSHWRRTFALVGALLFCATLVPTIASWSTPTQTQRESMLRTSTAATYSYTAPAPQHRPLPKVLQSSITGDRFLHLTPEILKQRRISVDKLSFGNRFLDIDSSSAAQVGTVSVNTEETKQEILGFGGAFTEAAALNYQKLPPAVQKRFIQLHFGDAETGLGYSMGRIHINSCDFCIESYSFDDVAGDFALDHFDMSVLHDQAAILPFIRDAISATVVQGDLREGNGIRLVASPWSPPAWMKVPTSNTSSPMHQDVQSMLGSAQPNGLLPNVQLTWAKYISKFIEAYSQQGVPIWAVTPQNEPEFAAPWEGCVYTADFESRFIANYLGPVLRWEHPHILILAFDHNKDHLSMWAEAAMGNGSSGSASYVDGMAFHWYNGVDDRTLDGTSGYSDVRTTHKKYPDKILLATEGCSCPGVQVGSWFRGERLGHDLMFDINNGARGWLDWNLLVDFNGGPNHLNNMCDAPVVANKDFSDIIIQPKYYFMGHFSKYIPPSSKRVSSKTVGNFSNALDNPNIQSGIELGMFACEHSSRQLWKLRSGDVLQLSVPAIADSQVSIASVDLCVIPAMSSSVNVRIGHCNYQGPGATPIQFDTEVVTGSNLIKSVRRFVGESTVIQLVSVASSQGPTQCLGVDTSTYNGDMGGSMLVLVLCNAEDASQLWMVDETSEQEGNANIISVGDSMQSSSRSCLTAGWPFLNVAAFQTHTNTVVVVMNESPSSTRYAVSSSAEEEPMYLEIGARSIQTIVF